MGRLHRDLSAKDTTYYAYLLSLGVPGDRAEAIVRMYLEVQEQHWAVVDKINKIETKVIRRDRFISALTLALIANVIMNLYKILF